LFQPIVTETAEYIKTNAEPGLAAPIIFLLAWSMRLLGDRGNSPG